MIRAVPGPLIVEPTTWLIVFDRKASTWWASWLAMGSYKHVRACAYVSFLHVWIFFDPQISGTDIIVAAKGEPAQRVFDAWTVDAAVIKMPRRSGAMKGPPIAGWCVPVIKRLIGLRCVAMRPDAFYRYCLVNGGEPFEVARGRAQISTAIA